MGTNTALLTRRVIDNVWQVFSVQYVALAQAVDCLHIADKLAPISRQVYRQVREICPVFIEDTPFYEDFRNVEAFLRHQQLKLD